MLELRNLEKKEKVSNEFNTNEHVMIDIETMGNENNSPILSLGLVQFNPYTGECLNESEINVLLESSLSAGAKPNADTILWWLNQSDEARKSLTETQKNAYSLEDALGEVSKFLKFSAMRAGVPIKELKVWGNGASFDLSIISNSYSLVGKKEPWMHYNERDVRTIVAFAPEVKNSLPFSGVRHTVISDSKHQVGYVSKTLQLITIKTN